MKFFLLFSLKLPFLFSQESFIFGLSLRFCFIFSFRRTKALAQVLACDKAFVMCCGNIFGGSFFDSFISFVVLSNRGSAADFGNQDYEKSAKRKCEKICGLFKLNNTRLLFRVIMY